MRVIIDLVEPHLGPASLVPVRAGLPNLTVPRLLRRRDERPPEDPSAVVFPDAEDSIWTWDEKAGQWYAPLLLAPA